MITMKSHRQSSRAHLQVAQPSLSQEMAAKEKTIRDSRWQSNSSSMASISICASSCHTELPSDVPFRPVLRIVHGIVTRPCVSGTSRHCSHQLALLSTLAATYFAIAPTLYDAKKYAPLWN